MMERYPTANHFSHYDNFSDIMALETDTTMTIIESQEFTTEYQQYLNSTENESENVTPVSVQILMCLMYTTISLAAIGGNGVVIYIIFAYKRMRTVTNIFIMNLAIGDILMACLCIPFTFVSNLILQFWPFGSVMCLVVSYAQAVSVFISAYTLIAISIDRYIAIIYPLRPRMTKLHSKLIIIVIWIVALLTPLPTALLSKLLPLPQDSNKTELTQDQPMLYHCTEDWPREDYKYYYSMLLMILQYAFPFSVLIFTYSRIAIVVWGKRPPGEAEDGRDARMAASKRKVIIYFLI
jgi:neuropeptide Y receptor